jgi:hypothetical protein
MNLSIEKIEVLKIDGQMFPIGWERAKGLKEELAHAVEVFSLCESGANTIGASWHVELTIELEDIDGTLEPICLVDLETALKLQTCVEELT